MKSFDKTQDLRIALVHDYIKEYGGAERVLEALHEIWPDAPVFTSVYLPEFLGPHKERFKDWDIRTSFLQYIPFKEKLISPFRIIAPFVFKMFDLSQYDVVIISATGAYFPNMVETKKNIVIARSEERATRQSHTEQGIASPLRGLAMTKRKGVIHICYSHTPPRYLYGFATAREWQNNLIFRAIGGIANHFLRLVDFKSSQNVDYFVANSKNVAGRIRKFYRREATVIYPPVDVRDTKTLRYKDIKKGNYFLAGGRLARPKHIGLIVRTFVDLKLSLKVFGRSFGDAPNILISQYPNISFLGEVSDEEKLELMRSAKAYIFAAEDEDFGITPVEAMNVGTPVIAFASGGVLESVIDNKTGIFYRLNDLNHLSEAIHKFEKMKFDRKEIAKYAQKFSKERFKKEIKEFVNSKFRLI